MTGVLERTHDVYFSNTPPAKMRIHLRDAPDSWMIVRIHYRTPNRVDVYKNGQRVAPETSWGDVNPESATSGTNVHDRESDMTDPTLIVLLKGDEPLDLIVSTSLQLSVGVTVTEAEFFTTGRAGLVANLAALLGIDPSQIVIPSSSTGRRQLQTLLSEEGLHPRQLQTERRQLQTGFTIIIEPMPAETVPTALVVDLSSSIAEQELELADAQGLSSISDTLASGASDIAGAIATSTGSEVGHEHLATSEVVFPIPGWTGDVANYDAVDSCHCDSGIW